MKYTGTVLLQQHLCKTIHRHANELLYFQIHSFEISIFILKRNTMYKTRKTNSMYSCFLKKYCCMMRA